MQARPRGCAAERIFERPLPHERFIPTFCKKGIDKQLGFCYNYLRGFIRGEMAERFKALVLKTSDVERHRGFESLSLRQN